MIIQMNLLIKLWLIQISTFNFQFFFLLSMRERCENDIYKLCNEMHNKWCAIQHLSLLFYFFVQLKKLICLGTQHKKFDLHCFFFIIFWRLYFHRIIHCWKAQETRDLFTTRIFENWEKKKRGGGFYIYHVTISIICKLLNL